MVECLMLLKMIDLLIIIRLSRINMNIGTQKGILFLIPTQILFDQSLLIRDFILLACLLFVFEIFVIDLLIERIRLDGGQLFVYHVRHDCITEFIFLYGIVIVLIDSAHESRIVFRGEATGRVSSFEERVY
jgi:hypothetical protein